MYREWSGQCCGCGRAVGGGRVLPLPLMVDLVIFGFRGKNTREGLVRNLVYAATAKYPEVSLQSTQKINDGK